MDISAIDSATARLVEQNGVRVGVGRTDRWAEVEQVLARIPDLKRLELPPMRVQPGMPLALELDAQPGEHTLFYLGKDGILSGDTWPQSRRALRLSYTLDVRDLDEVYLSVVPEIRGPRQVDFANDQGVWTTAQRRSGRAFAAAGLAVKLGPQQFTLVGPNDNARLRGLVGGAFFTDIIEGEPVDCLLFVRTDVRHVDQHR